jgi:fatty-acyl-CoA synthase
VAQKLPLLIKDLLLTPRGQATRQEIVYQDRVRYGYPTLLDRIARLSDALKTLGVGFGDTVAVMEWDSHRYLECFFGIPMIGAILQTVNIRLSPEQIAYTLNHAQASVILCNVEFMPVLSTMRAGLGHVRKIICLSDDDMVLDPEIWDGEYETMLAAAQPLTAFPDFDENTIATTFYTTGTTGLPKGVYYSHRQIVIHTLAELATLALGDINGHFSRDDVYMPITPMFHAHAWGIPFVATMAGCKQVYPGRYTPERLIELFSREKVTFSHCVPTLLQMILDSPLAVDVDFSGWRVLIGGTALPKTLIRQGLARGIDVIHGYGMSESGPLIVLSQLKAESFTNLEEEITLRGKAGMPVPLVDLRIVDDAMREVPHDGHAVGEIVVRAPWLTEGYRHNPEASAALWEGGYLHTQDLGTIDADGYLKITDRTKDVIKSGGEWISSLELEDLIGRLEAVREVAVIGVADDRWTERPMAIIVTRHGANIDASDVRKHLNQWVDSGSISKFAVPEHIQFVEALDRTSVGKIDKKTLRQKFGA